MIRIPALLGLVMAGCAAPSGVAVDSSHPASASAATSGLVVSATPLAPAAVPDLPAPLRPSAHPHAMGDHDPSTMPDMEMETPAMAMEHGAMDHAAEEAHLPASAADAAPIRAVLDAYLAVHDALAADRLAPDAADQFATALVVWTETPPADDPHFWHMRSEDVAAARQSAAAVAAATDLDAGREAFGALGAPFARLVEATGVPEGYDLARFTCGMVDAPGGGVWLQPAGDTANPYFGTSMAMCGTHDGVIPSATEPGSMDHDGHGTHR